jgi:hypothetical protein
VAIWFGEARNMEEVDSKNGFIMWQTSFNCAFRPFLGFGQEKVNVSHPFQK